MLPHAKWTLVGGLMAQLHGIHAGIDAVRPTNDIDIVLHVETTRGIASETARALEALGYELVPSIDERNNTAQRFRRGESTVDVVTNGPDVVDSGRDHAAPRGSRSSGDDGRHRVRHSGPTSNDQRTAPDRRRPDHHGEPAIAVRRGHPQGRRVPGRLPRSGTSSPGRRTPARGHRGPLPRTRSGSPAPTAPDFRCWPARCQTPLPHGERCRPMPGPTARPRCGS